MKNKDLIQPLLTVNEAAEYLRVNTETLRRLMRSRRIKFVKISERERRFRLEDLKSFVETLLSV